MKIKIFAILLAGLLLTGCGQNQNEENNLSEQPSTEEIGEQSQASNEAANEEPFVVTFEATTLDGETITSDIFAESKLTMLNVWATYCNPCLNEMPDLAEIATTYDSADFRMLGIISDVFDSADEDTLSEAKALIDETGATTYSHLLLNESLYSNLVGGIDSVPTTFFVNQAGEMLGYVIGAHNKETWEGVINELLAETE